MKDGYDGDYEYTDAESFYNPRISIPWVFVIYFCIVIIGFALMW